MSPALCIACHRQRCLCYACIQQLPGMLRVPGRLHERHQGAGHSMLVVALPSDQPPSQVSDSPRALPALDPAGWRQGMRDAEQEAGRE